MRRMDSAAVAARPAGACWNDPPPAGVAAAGVRHMGEGRGHVGGRSSKEVAVCSCSSGVGGSTPVVEETFRFRRATAQQPLNKKMHNLRPTFVYVDFSTAPHTCAQQNVECRVRQGQERTLLLREKGSRGCFHRAQWRANERSSGFGAAPVMRMVRIAVHDAAGYAPPALPAHHAPSLR